MIKYFCDTCGNEVAPASSVSPRPISTIEIIDPTTGKQSAYMLCRDCTPLLEVWIRSKQKENGVVAVSEDFNLKIQK